MHEIAVEGPEGNEILRGRVQWRLQSPGHKGKFDRASIELVGSGLNDQEVESMESDDVVVRCYFADRPGLSRTPGEFTLHGVSKGSTQLTIEFSPVIDMDELEKSFEKE